MNAYTTRTFKSGNSEAVRLPKEFSFGAGSEVEVTSDGDTVTIRRKRLSNRELVEKLREIGPPPGGVQEREPIEWPERPGL